MLKAVVLAAGKGTRLGSLTQATPKPMLPVNGHPLIHYTLTLLASSGVTDVFINLHHCPDVLTAYCATGERWGVRITYSHEPELLGSAGTIRHLGDALGSAPFYVLYGDNYFECDLMALADFHRQTNALATIGLTEKADTSGSGIVALDTRGRIRRFKEKPSAEEVFSHLVNAGVYVLSPEVLPLIPASTPCDFGQAVFPALLARDHALYGLLAGPVWGSDTPELYRALLAHLSLGS